MSDTTDMMATVQRERLTEALVSNLDAAGVVEWIHALQDREEEQEAEAERLTDHLRSRGEHIEYLRADGEKLVAEVERLRGVLTLVDTAMRELRPYCTDGGDIADVLDSFIPAVRDALPREGDAPCT